MNNNSSLVSNVSRRGFLSLAGAAALTASLSACAAGGGSSASSGTLKFWDMPWGTSVYATEAEKLAKSFTGAGNVKDVSYQQVLWNGFNETYSSAIASKTGPAVSTGGGFQAFQFAAQGAVEYADKLIESFKSNGLYDDFLPNVLDAMKTPQGSVAVPWAVDIQTLWYRKSVLEAADVAAPTTWTEFIEAGKKIAAKGYYAWGISGGSGNFGPMAILSLMINNGGGLFNDGGDLDIVTDRNTETSEFVIEAVKAGLTDPGAVSLKDDDLVTQWTNKKIGMGFYYVGLDEAIGDNDVVVMDPLKGPHGDTGTIQYVNNIMMYKNTPSQEASEAFVTHYLQNMKVLWEKKLVSQLPALKSIAGASSFTGSQSNVAIVNKWQPIAKTLATKGTQSSAKLAAIDGGQAMADFCQTLLGGKTDAKSALTKLESDIKAVVSS
ncbi:extracellular solute-binding protein [Arthrobacter sp. SLBN-112]|uniref:ABC transporter substrate-binding protein n=1 Tax=Arthrobacter sp. SLBN-112 TaxID=2768452 RepID=UPI0027B27A39|nr:extracellular solute-binding protein [Arthrobacter sp. SLBN-112]MDQ0801484.1 multiple sugar transport system substrate-binding protein [Arthrobacter sp. SLBN-112]